MSFTAEEVWQVMPKVKGEENLKSIHLSSWPKPAQIWCDKELERKWQRLYEEVRPVVLKAMEEKRNSGVIGNSLEAGIDLITKDGELLEFLKSFSGDLPSIFIASEVHLKFSENLPEEAVIFPELPSLAVKVEKAKGKKCQRCWNYNTDVGAIRDHPELCARCTKVI